MAPQRKRRFANSSNNLEAKKAREERALKDYTQLHLNDSPNIIKGTKDLRKRVIEE